MLDGVALAIDMFATPATLTRDGQGGQFVGGIWQPATPEEIEIDACIHAVSPEETMNLDEGIRTRAAIVIYSRAELRTADEGAGTEADLIAWRGETFKLLQVWPRIEGSYHKAVAERVG